MQRSLVILKPDAISRGLTGEIISRLEKKGLKLVACKMKYLDENILREHYSHHADKPFFPTIIGAMTSAPVLLQAWEGVDAADVIRLLVGVTNARQAQPGTIRGDYAMSLTRNIIHASESAEIGEEEIKRFFDENELCSYKNCNEDVLYVEEELN